MPRFLSDIRIVDISHSEWDKKASDPKHGKYVFTVKNYINYHEKARRPELFFSWCHYNPRDGLIGVRDWQVKFNYRYITINDPYWPEGLAPDEDGKYVFGDVVLMARPLVEELKDRIDNQNMANLAAGRKLEAFNMDATKEGVGVDEQTLKSMMERG